MAPEGRGMPPLVPRASDPHATRASPRASPRGAALPPKFGLWPRARCRGPLPLREQHQLRLPPMPPGERRRAGGRGGASQVDYTTRSTQRSAVNAERHSAPVRWSARFQHPSCARSRSGASGTKLRRILLEERAPPGLQCRTWRVHLRVVLPT